MQQIVQNLRNTSLWLWVLLALAAVCNFLLPRLLAKRVSTEGQRTRYTLLCKLVALGIAVFVAAMVLLDKL